MRRSIILNACVVLAALLFVASMICMMASMNFSFSPKPEDDPTVYPFSIEDYQDEIDQMDWNSIPYYDCMSADRNVGSIPDKETAAMRAEEVWGELYGEETIAIQKPFIVDYDKEHKVWLVTGRWNFGEGWHGGVAFILMEREGKVLTIGHEK